MGTMSMLRSLRRQRSTTLGTLLCVARARLFVKRQQDDRAIHRTRIARHCCHITMLKEDEVHLVGRATHIPMWIIAILMLLWQAVAAHAGPLEDCEQVQDIDRRIHGCTHIVRLFPRSATAFFNRGSAYLSKGDLDRAIADHTRVIQIDPAYSPAYYHRGIAYERSEQHDRAIADLSKAVELDPRHGGAFDARARIYLKTDRRMLALPDAERAVSLDPFGEEFLDTRARVYEALGRTKEAIADYRRLLSSNPSMKSAIDGLGRLGVSSSALNAPADAARKAKRSAKPHHYSAQPLYSQEEKTKRSAKPHYYAAQPGYSQEEIECERTQQADPGGRFAGYPCWARSALGNRGRGR